MKHNIKIEEHKMDILVNTLLEKIKTLEDRISELGKVTIDNCYYDFCEVMHKSMIEALKEKGVDFTYKSGDIVTDGRNIFVVNYIHPNTDVHCYAALWDFSSDNQHIYNVEVCSCVAFSSDDDIRPASQFEIILLDYELKKAGYKRTDSGKVIKI